MDALARINRDFGITVICNLHSLELARGYCGRLIGMAAGRVVFDGTPEQLTETEARRLYGLESEARGTRRQDRAAFLPRNPFWAYPRSRSRHSSEYPRRRAERDCLTHPTGEEKC